MGSRGLGGIGFKEVFTPCIHSMHYHCSLPPIFTCSLPLPTMCHYSNAVLACVLRSDILKDTGVLAAILAPLAKSHFRPLLKYQTPPGRIIEDLVTHLLWAFVAVALLASE
jgi:hypothetical protein